MQFECVYKGVYIGFDSVDQCIKVSEVLTSPTRVRVKLVKYESSHRDASYCAISLNFLNNICGFVPELTCILNHL